MLDHDDSEQDSEDRKYGTIGAIARDLSGNIAAATSTGGIVNKRLGRVGDSPIIGACVYAENDKCAVSATGFGEDFMRTAIADTIAGYIDVKGMDAAEAVSAGIEYQVCKVRGRGGVIAVDHAGNCSSKFTTDKYDPWVDRERL